MMGSQHRICIILTGGIGDFIASLPALDRIRRGFPGSRRLLLGNPLWLPLVQAVGWVQEIRSVDDLPVHAGFTGRLPGDHPLRRFLADFDLIISWFGDREGLWEATLREACTGRLRVHPYHRVHGFEGHVSEYYLTTLQGLGLPAPDRAEVHLAPVPLLRDAVRSRSLSPGNDSHGEARFLCLHPGSGSLKKNWPREKFLEVARGAFARWRLPSLVVIGPAEQDQKAFWRKATGPALSVTEKPALLETAETLFRASLYVGNDSGITHLASAVGTPVVALFGPTDPVRWAPRGGRVEIMRQEASAEQVLDTLGRLQEDSSIIL